MQHLRDSCVENKRCEKNELPSTVSLTLNKESPVFIQTVVVLPMTNPYAASDVDESPAEIVRFFRVKAEPQQIVGTVLWEAMHYVYSTEKRAYIALGFLQAFYLGLVIGAGLVIWNFGEIIGAFLVGVTVVSLFVLWVLLYIMSLNAIFRLLRKERMAFAPSLRELLRLCRTLLHGVLFLASFLAVIVLATLMFVPGMILTDNVLSNIGTNTPKLILGICLYATGTVLWIAFVCLFYMRSALGLHCIVDQGDNFLTAYRRAWSLTRGNLRALAFGTPSTSKPLMTFLILTFSLGLGFFPLIGYYFCWLTVAYLMLSGQCETIAQQPDEW